MGFCDSVEPVVAANVVQILFNTPDVFFYPVLTSPIVSPSSHLQAEPSSRKAEHTYLSYLDGVLESRNGMSDNSVDKADYFIGYRPE